MLSCMLNLKIMHESCLYSEFECGLSNDGHYLKDAILLSSCGHGVCRSCLIKEHFKEVKCKLCGKITNRNMSNDEISIIYQKYFKQNLNSLLVDIEQKMSQCLTRLKGKRIKKQHQIIKTIYKLHI